MKTEEEIKAEGAIKARSYSDKFKHLKLTERIGAEIWYKDGYLAGHSAASSIQEAALREAVEALKEAEEVIRLDVYEHYRSAGFSVNNSHEKANNHPRCLKYRTIINKHTSHE